MFIKLLLYLYICTGLAIDPNLDCPGIIIVPRDEWGSVIPKIDEELSETPKFVFIHHTESETCSTQNTCEEYLRNLQLYDTNILGRKDVGMNFLIGGDGRIYEGRGWNTVGDHTPGYPQSIGISFIGNYDDFLPTSSMIKAAKNLLNCGVKKGTLDFEHSVNGHRDASCSHCPGNALHGEISTWSGFRIHDLSYRNCWEKK
uniref:Peptidoglycan-recognition protein n=1 Tax=Strigamia maritima TaxID=126957 RepID=T1JHT0_STRMM